MTHDVFLSYSESDASTAQAACEELEAAGLRCWMAPRDVAPGSEWAGEIVRAIEGAKAMVLVFSSHAVTSRQVGNEVERAVNLGVPVVPLRIENVLPNGALAYFLGSCHWLDAVRPPLTARLAELAKAVQAFVAAPDDASGAKAAGLVSLARMRRPRLSRGQRLARVAGVAAAASLLLGALWAGGRDLEASRRQNGSHLAIVEVRQRVQRLDRRTALVRSQFEPHSLQQSLAVPGDIGRDTAGRQYAGVLRDRATWLAQTLAQTAVGAPLTGNQRQGLVDAGCAATDVAAFEQALAGVESQCALLLDHCRRHARFVEVSPQVAHELRLAIANLDAQRLASELAALQAHFGSLQLLTAATAEDPVMRRAVAAELAALVALEPRVVLTPEVTAATNARLEELAREVPRRIDEGVLPAIDASNADLVAAHAGLRREWDDFEPLASDSPDRLVQKAIVARGSQEPTAAVKCFEWFGANCAGDFPMARQYGETGAAYTRATWRDQYAASFVYVVLADSTARGMLEPGDVIERIDDVVVDGPDAVVAALASRREREIRVGFVRRGDDGSLARREVAVYVPADGRLRVGLQRV